MKFYLMCLVVALIVATTIISCYPTTQDRRVIFVFEDGSKLEHIFTVKSDSDLSKQIDDFVYTGYVEMCVFEEPIAIIMDYSLFD